MPDDYRELYNRLLERHAKLTNAVAGAVMLLKSLGGMLPGTKQVVDMAVKQLEQAVLKDSEQ